MKVEGKLFFKFDLFLNYSPVQVLIEPRYKFFSIYYLVLAEDIQDVPFEFRPMLLLVKFFFNFS